MLFGREIEMAGSSRLIQLLAGAATTLFASAALARGASADRDCADALFEEAKSLMARSRFFEACPKLVEARRIDPRAGGTVLALALCREGEEKLATALVELRTAKTMAQAVGNHDRETLATERIDALAPHVSKVVLRRARRGTRVTVDGVLPGADGVVEVDGGEHVVRVEGLGEPTWEQRVSVATKDDTRVVDLPEPPASATPAIAATPPLPREGGHTRNAGLLVGGVGVVAALVGGCFGIRALGAQSDSRALCSSSPCSSDSGVASHTTAQHDAIGADVGLGIGLAGIGAGVVLFLIDKGQLPPAAALIAPSFTERSAGVALSGRF
jgi:hypothetical protein